jgi:predicted lysophospholipase L1 biosynthesis ABC-type transport system permease subunit
MAEKFWGGQAIGHTVTPLFGSRSDAVWIPRADRRPLTIVGIVNDVREDGVPELPDDRAPQLYLAYAQNPTPIMTVVARASGNLKSAGATIRSAVHAIDPEQPTFDERTLDDVRRDTFSRARELAWLVGAFAALALLLAAVGVYAVVSYLTSMRAHEIGIRIAIGASPAAVVRLVVRDAVKLAAVGVTLGIAITPAALSAIRSLLFGVTATDPALLSSVAIAVVAITLAAAAVPAVRAAASASASFR